MSTRYRVEARRSGRWWALAAPEVGVHTQVKRLNQAEAMAREAIALALEVDESEVEIDLRVTLDDDTQHLLQRVGEARRAAEAAQRAAQRAAGDAAQSLHRAGLSTREVGLLMGLSHQRVHQLIEG